MNDVICRSGGGDGYRVTRCYPSEHRNEERAGTAAVLEHTSTKWEDEYWVTLEVSVDSSIAVCWTGSELPE